MILLESSRKGDTESNLNTKIFIIISLNLNKFHFILNILRVNASIVLSIYPLSIKGKEEKRKKNLTISLSVTKKNKRRALKAVKMRIKIFFNFYYGSMNTTILSVQI